MPEVQLDVGCSEGIVDGQGKAGGHLASVRLRDDVQRHFPVLQSAQHTPDLPLSGSNTYSGFWDRAGMHVIGMQAALAT